MSPADEQISPPACANWVVAFHPSIQAWHEHRECVLKVAFDTEQEAVIWARTQEMGQLRVAAVCRGQDVHALYLQPPPDPTLMRQERVEIPIVVRPSLA